MLAITGWKDQQESKRKSERIRIGFDRIKANNALYGRPPYGFASEGDKYHRRIVHKPGEAEVLTEAAQRYLGGESLQDIARDLNRRGVPSPTWHGKPGTHWYPRTVGVLLRNPAMIGRRMDRNGQTTTRFEPLISVKEFERIDRLMKSRAHRKGVPYRGETAMLTTVLRCVECGGPVYAITARRARYYYCRSGHGCKNLIRENIADQQVSDWITSHPSYEILEKRVTPGHNYDDQIANVRQDIRELDPEAEDYDQRLADLRAELHRLRGLPSTPDRIEWIGSGRFAADEWPAWSKAERRAFLIDNGFEVSLHPSADWLPTDHRIVVMPGDVYEHRVLRRPSR